MSSTAPYIAAIQTAYPELMIHDARLLTGEGQFSDVLFVNHALVFRFPRTPHIVTAMTREVTVLKRLQGRLPLPVPNPTYAHYDSDGQLIFMGYKMLPGEPLWREVFSTITDEGVLNRLAEQLAGFLKAIHDIPPAEVGLNMPPEGSREEWQSLYMAIRESLFVYMRPDAREQVTVHFETALNDPELFAFEPVLRHGDFGTGNILYDAEAGSISGVIDFSFCAAGDPAQDTAALLSSYGEAFVQRCTQIYPAMQTMQKRVVFIRGTYALQQALVALHDGNQEDFQDGMQAYV